MYQAIYRKYRPKTFDQVLGQDEITRVLKNQVALNRIGHAYIFSGTRGTGKTSCAKIMSRAVNCLEPQEGNPCNQCFNCKSILAEDTMDVVEMDAASNRRIDDIRDLREKVIYPPAFLKYKVYIIDEAHMITNEGFNALLKIMEEPPEHLIFILATTELEKIPDTIQSRCQRFEFNRLGLENIEESLIFISQDLGYSLDSEAARMIAVAGKGAMRDAQSILDQVIASSGEKILPADVARVVGMAEESSINQLVNWLIQGDGGQALAGAEKMVKAGGNELEILSGLMAHYQSLLNIGAGGRPGDLEEDQVNLLREQARSLSPKEIADSMGILMDAQQKARHTDQKFALLQISIVELAQKRNRENLLSRVNYLEGEVARLWDYIQSGNFNSPPSRPVGEGLEEARPESRNMGHPIEAKPSLRPSDGLEPKELVRPELGNQQADIEPPSDLDGIIAGWNDFLKLTIGANRMWGMWLDGANPISFDKGILTVEMREDGETAYKMAKEKEDELGQLLKAFYNFEMTIVMVQEEIEEEENPKIEKYKRIFGDDLEIIGG